MVRLSVVLTGAAIEPPLASAKVSAEAGDHRTERRSPLLRNP